MCLIKSIISFDPFQTPFWLSKWKPTCSHLCWLFCLSLILLQNSQFVLLHPAFFFFPHFLTFKPQVTPKPKIIAFWMRSSHMISFRTWPNESSSSTAPAAYEQPPFPSGSAEWLNGSELTRSKETICQCLNLWQTSHCASQNISGVTGDLQTIGSFLCIWKHLYLRSSRHLHQCLFYKTLVNT